MTSPNYISYKDATARVVESEGAYYRYIFKTYQAEYDHLIQSGLYKALLDKGLVIAHEEINTLTLGTQAHQDQVYKLIKPAQIHFQSYPFEWSFEQWKKAMHAYLTINKIALEYGMILKDATPYNFYLKAGKAIMFDTSSFMFFKGGDKWIAYKQFCTEFLSPIALMYYNGQRWSRITRTHLRGLPLNFVSKQLSVKSWFNTTVLLHIHLHAKYANAEGDTRKLDKDCSATQKSKQGFSIEKINSLLDMIQSSVKQWNKAHPFEKHWSSYYQHDIESANYLKHKEQVVTTWLDKLRPNRVLDLGANTGKFSFMAANYANSVIAMETDDVCVDIIERQIKKEKSQKVKTLVMDLAETTSNIGVLNKELSSIYTRAMSEMVMALAIVHHLHISNQLSFEQIAEMFSLFSTQYLIVEFVPITDSKVQILMKDKTGDFSNYTQTHFLNCLLHFFVVKESIALKDSTRTLLLLEKIK